MLILSIFSRQVFHLLVFVILTRCLFHLSCCPLPHLRKLSLGWRELWANVLLHQMVAIWESFSPENLTQPLIDPCMQLTMQLMPAWHQRRSVDPEYWHCWHLYISQLTYFPLLSHNVVGCGDQVIGHMAPVRTGVAFNPNVPIGEVVGPVPQMNYHEPLPQPIANMPSLSLKKLIVTKSHEKILEGHNKL